MTNRQNQNVLSLIQSIESLNAQAQGEAGAIETLFTETPTYRGNKAPSLVQQLAQNAAHLEGASDTSNIKNLPKASIILSSQDKDETDGQDDFDKKLSKLMLDVQYQDDNRPATISEKDTLSGHTCLCRPGYTIRD